MDITDIQEYPKIESVFHRERSEVKGRKNRVFPFVEGSWRLPEFEYLRKCDWIATEKVDGTNIRVYWDCEKKRVLFGGRTARAQLSTHLLSVLQSEFPAGKFEVLYPDVSILLFGEGYGNKIQSGGKYVNGEDRVGFVCFDVKIGDWWLKYDDMVDVCDKLDVKTVPIFGRSPLDDIVQLVRDRKYVSSFGDFIPEGIVARPVVDLKTRRGDRIITKIKDSDFRRD